MANANDIRVIAAMGDKFEKFQTMARMCKEQPATRGYAEAQMSRILETMNPAERLELRRALLAAGGKK
jgi:hypothetical protein